MDFLCSSVILFLFLSIFFPTVNLAWLFSAAFFISFVMSKIYWLIIRKIISLPSQSGTKFAIESIAFKICLFLLGASGLIIAVGFIVSFAGLLMGREVIDIFSAVLICGMLLIAILILSLFVVVYRGYNARKQNKDGAFN